jgi:hypothetical protein
VIFKCTCPKQDNKKNTICKYHMMLVLHKTIDFDKKAQVDVKVEAIEVFITTMYI